MAHRLKEAGKHHPHGHATSRSTAEKNQGRIIGETAAGKGGVKGEGGGTTRVGPLTGTREGGKGPSIHVGMVDAHNTGYSHHAGRAPYHDGARHVPSPSVGEGTMWKNR